MKSKSWTTHKAFDEQGRRSQSCWRPCRSRCPLSSWSKSQKRGSKGERRLCMPVTCCLSWGSLLAKGGFLRQQITSPKIFVVVFVVCCYCLRQNEICSACSYFWKKRHPMIPTCVQMNISQTGFFTAIRGFKMTSCMTANFDSPTVRPPLNTLHSIWGYFSTRLWKR